MPLFEIKNQTISTVRSNEFKLERELQNLVEKNLEAVFNCRFVASEFPTGIEHAGRIDTLAISEDLNPVIIEYKKVESSELVNQSLYYLSWIHDHRGDFQIAVNKAIGEDVEIDWSEVRVICLAPGFKKYDLHAVRMMGANIELWQYRLFENQCLYLEEVFSRTKHYSSEFQSTETSKNPIYVAAGKKAAATRATGSYTYDEHLEDVSAEVKEIAEEIREFSMGLDESVEENPKKFYVAYRTTQNFVCLQTARNKVTLFLKLDPREEAPLPSNARDMSKIGHFGTGNYEFTVRSKDDLPLAKELIRKAFDRMGG